MVAVSLGPDTGFDNIPDYTKSLVDRYAQGEEIAGFPLGVPSRDADFAAVLDGLTQNVVVKWFDAITPDLDAVAYRVAHEALMAALGGTGFRELASLNHDKAEYLKAALQAAGLEVPFASATFNEFVVKFPEGFDQRWQDLLQKKILAGIPMVCYYPELANHYLLCVTETRSKDDMDALVKEVQS